MGVLCIDCSAAGIKGLTVQLRCMCFCDYTLTTKYCKDINCIISTGYGPRRFCRKRSLRESELDWLERELDRGVLEREQKQRSLRESWNEVLEREQ